MLALNSLRVHSASVNGHEGSAINTFVVSPHFGSPPAAELLRQQFILALEGELDVLASLDKRDRDAAQHGTTRAGEVPDAVPINHAAAPPRILWSEGAEPGELVVQIRATDRAGLLARLTAVFERDGVDIAWAKVTTLGSSVVDVFSITAVGDGDSALSADSRPPARSARSSSATCTPCCRRPHPRSRSPKPARLNGVFESLSDRLTGALQGLRGKGRLTDADIDATTREIRLALLEADVSLPVVRAFVARIKERAKGAEVSGALNPAQQVVKIVNEELIGILGGETRQLAFAKTPPTVIMLAGLQGSGKTTLAGKLAKWLRDQGHTPLLVACDLQRPGAVNQLQIVGERAGVQVFAPHPGCRPKAPSERRPRRSGRGRRCGPGRGQGQALRRRHRRHRRPARHRRGADGPGRGDPRGRRPRRSDLRARRDDRPGRRHHGRGVPRGRRLHRRRADQARR